MCWASTTENWMTVHMTWTFYFFATEPLHVLSAPRKATSKNPQLPRRRVIGGPGARCGPPGTRRGFRPFPMWIWAWELSAAPGTSDVQSSPSSREILPWDAEGRTPLKVIYSCHFTTLPLGTFSVTEIVGKLLQKWERNKNMWRF